MAMLGVNWFYAAAWLRRYLARRLYPDKVRWRAPGGGIIVPEQGLTILDHGVLMTLTIAICALVVASTILGFLGAVRIIYG